MVSAKASPFFLILSTKILRFIFTGLVWVVCQEMWCLWGQVWFMVLPSKQGWDNSNGINLEWKNGDSSKESQGAFIRRRDNRCLAGKNSKCPLEELFPTHIWVGPPPLLRQDWRSRWGCTCITKQHRQFWYTSLLFLSFLCHQYTPSYLAVYQSTHLPRIFFSFYCPYFI